MRWCVSVWLAVGCVTHDSVDATAEDTDTDSTEVPTGCALGDPPENWDFIPFDYPGEDFAFDATGHLVTVADWAESVIRTDRSGRVEVMAPFTSEEVAGVDFLAGGDLVVADEANGALKRMTGDWAEVLIAGGVPSPNSVAVSSSGYVYVTAFDTVERVDPDTGVRVPVTASPGQDLDGLTFSPDFRYLWFNEDETGIVRRIELDEDGLERVTEEMAQLPLGHADHQLDGMTTDACGNLYILRTDGKIRRLRPDGSQVDGTFANLQEATFTSALHFGSGIGGWARDHLYVMDRFGGLFDLDVGIDGVPEPHL